MKLVKVKLHGDIANYIEPEWELRVDSAKQAISAINTLTNNKFNNYFIEKGKLYTQYRILINGRDFFSPEREITDKNAEVVTRSEIYMKRNDIQTIDIVPLIEAANSKSGGIISSILGIILIVVDVAFVHGGQLASLGIALLAAGVTSLLTRPPKASFRDAPNNKDKSYLFGGPVNTVGEGGPVPIGYGNVIIGSQVISSSYKIDDYSIT